MKDFIAKIAASIELNQREVYVIYVNDVCKDLFDEQKETLPLYKLLECPAWRDTRIYHHVKAA